MEGKVRSTSASHDASFESCLGQLKTKYHRIVQSLPSNYEDTLQLIQDQLSDDQICKVLGSPNSSAANDVILNSLLEKVKCKSDITDACNTLESIALLLPDPTNLSTIVTEIKTDLVPSKSSAVEINLPRKVLENKDLLPIKMHYQTILQLMPTNYEPSVGKLQHCLSDDQICTVLSASDSRAANKVILDCLIEKISGKLEINFLCDQLDSIATSTDLRKIIQKIRQVANQEHQNPTNSGAVIPPVIQTSPMHGLSMSYTNSPMYCMLFSQMSLDDNSRVKAVLKKNFGRLCECLPQDCKKTIGEMQKTLPGPDYMFSKMAQIQNPRMANEMIIFQLLMAMKSDIYCLAFCDILKTLVDCEASRQLIHSVRQEFLDTFNSPPTQPITMQSSHPVSIGSISLGESLLTKGNVSHSKRDVIGTKADLKKELQLAQDQQKQGIRKLEPQPLPSTYVCRQQLLDEIAMKLCESTIEPSSYGITVTLNGVGGFGKTTAVIALCYHELVKNHFTDGFLFMVLGPQATDPAMKLKSLYHLLTGKHCEVSSAQQKLNQLTGKYCRNLLVIIDDMWHIEDAEPIVKAFSNCKIVLTTRMNDNEQTIPSIHTITVGPLQQNEAINVLTKRVMDPAKISREDMDMLVELAHDFFLWPLLLSLIRGQLQHSLKQHKSCHNSIQHVRSQLQIKGLAGIDKQSADLSKLRQHAVKVCIEKTLDLLSDGLKKKTVLLILYTGIGISLQTAVLQYIWNTSKGEANDAVDDLWAFGLVQFSNLILPPHDKAQHLTEVHTVISQFIIENTESDLVHTFKLGSSKFGAGEAVGDAIEKLFQKSYDIHDPSAFTPTDFLQYRICLSEYGEIPFFLRFIHMELIYIPHNIMTHLHKIKNLIINEESFTALFPTIDSEINSLIDNSQQILNNSHIISRKLNKAIQQPLAERKYNKVAEEIEIYSKTYPFEDVAKQGVSLFQNWMPYLNGQLKTLITDCSETLQLYTSEYNHVTLWVLPHIKLFIKEIEEVADSLQKGSPYIELTYHAITYERKGFEERDIIQDQRLIKQQEVAPNQVSKYYQLF